jgi:(p)ppGpp synthase/HD superfamily hydrolase
MSLSYRLLRTSIYDFNGISLRITASSAIVGNTWDNNGLAIHMKKSPLLVTTTEQQLMMIVVSWPQKTMAPRSMATTTTVNDEYAPGHLISSIFVSKLLVTAV